MSFVTQGPVPPSSPMFVGRAPELDLFRRSAIELNCFVAVMGARQTGKSSLMLRFGRGLPPYCAVVPLNFQQIEGGSFAETLQFTASEMLRRLELPPAAHLPSTSPAFLSFLRDVSRRSGASRICIVIDEYPAVAPESAMKFAHTCRSVFNDRFITEEYMTFFVALSGAADMLQLTSGRNSPLANVTESIFMQDLTLAETTLLLANAVAPEECDAVAGAIHAWTAGHPYWTQLLGSRVVSPDGRFLYGSVDTVARQLIAAEDRNLAHLMKGVGRENRLRAVLHRILSGANISFTRADATIAELELIGAIRNSGGSCAIRNRIYEELFRQLLFEDRAVAVEGYGERTSGEVGGPLRVLHLSDLHIRSEDEAKQHRIQLTADLRHELDIERLDGMVLSGDIADHGWPREYEAAADFLEALIADFNVPRTRIAIVPGNHDVNWDLSIDGYQFVPRFRVTDINQPGVIPAGDAGVLVPKDELSYGRRLEPFANLFYSRFAGNYPLERRKQATLVAIPECRVLFLCMNTCWQLDHHFRERASIDHTALAGTLETVTTRQFDGWLKIAVWHHPVTGQGSINDDFLETLSVNGFAIGMHGHIHRAIDPKYAYDSRRGMRIIGAGTFGAPPDQLVTSTPLQYNILTLDPLACRMTVISRKKEKSFGSWSADARWGDKNAPRAWYEIDLNGRWNPGGVSTGTL